MVATRCRAEGGENKHGGGELAAPASGTDKDAERAGFVEAIKAHFVHGDYSFARTPDGEYYNTVGTRSYGGRVQPEYAPVSMLWKIWQAAHSKAGEDEDLNIDRAQLDALGRQKG
jgi:hypothetical protein